MNRRGVMEEHSVGKGEGVGSKPGAITFLFCFVHDISDNLGRYAFNEQHLYMIYIKNPVY